MKSIGESGFHVEPVFSYSTNTKKLNLVCILVTRKNQEVSENHKALQIVLHFPMWHTVVIL